MDTPQISIVIPLYNESECIPELFNRLDLLLHEVSFSLEIVLIDDGSEDNTSDLIEEKALTDEHYQSVVLSKNHGHPIALTAGLTYARGTEGVMIIDGDLQDPPEMITEFYNHLKNGYDVIYGVREKRKEVFVKKFLYWIYYRILKVVSNIEIPLDSGDFSMLSRKVVNIIIAMPEKSRFLRGMRSWVGYKQISVHYERAARVKGESKYGINKLFELAYNGIYNFSEVPIKFILKLGFITMLVSIVYLAYVLYNKVTHSIVPQGFTTLIIAIVWFSGVQLLSLGIIGEYVLRIFWEVKNRPLFIVKKIIEDKKVKPDPSYMSR